MSQQWVTVSERAMIKLNLTVKRFLIVSSIPAASIDSLLCTRGRSEDSLAPLQRDWTGVESKLAAQEGVQRGFKAIVGRIFRSERKLC